VGTYPVEVAANPVTNKVYITNFGDNTVSVIDGNTPPDAEDDNAETTINESVTIDVLANDSDPDGNPLIVDSITIEPIHGFVTINPDNIITYTPEFAYAGTDSFEYQISDGNGGTDTAMVSITVDVIAIPPLPPLI
jgi:DNA-binding beta-propeller fold protein YncE